MRTSADEAEHGELGNFARTRAGSVAPFGMAWPFCRYLSRPSLLLEQRAGLELAGLLSHPVYYGVGIPRGDGSPVLLIPGFLGSDNYLLIMSSWLRRIGYRPHASGLYINAGRPFELIARIIRRAEAVATAEGARVTVVGHSLGGVFGRVLAGLRPDLVEHVIALGSPLGEDGRRAAHPFVAALAGVMLREGTTASAIAAERRLERELISGPLPDQVRLTSVYSREDAVVDWRSCIDPDPRAAAHEVRGTHVGLAWNPQVYAVVGRALLRTL